MRRGAAAATIVAAVGLLAVGWWTCRVAGGGAQGDGPEPDLLRIAAELRASDDPFFGTAQVAALERERAAIEPGDPRRAVDVDLKLYGNRLRLGDVDGAIAAAASALAVARGVPELAARLDQFELRLGFAWMRKGEGQNCIARHAPACCIWPLAGEGLHTDRAPAAHALDLFVAALQRQPGDPALRWLAHLAASACQQQERVPAALRWPAPSPAASPQFVDRAPDLGVDTFDLCGGAATVDVDGDGCLDLVSTTWDPSGSMKLFRSRGDGTFEDRSVASGLARQLGGLNLTVADYDNDGDPDLLVLRGAWLMDRGRIRKSLLQNDGHGNFRDVTAVAGLMRPARPSQNAVWADFDGDGDLDLFVGCESRRDMEPGGDGDYPSQLFRNNGDGTFTDIAAAAGVTNDRYCKGACAGDYDNDGDLDLYVSNMGANRLYRNDGNMHFTDVAPELGVTEPVGRSFACWFFDYDNDGWLDLFVAGYEATLGDIAADMLRLRGESVPGGGERPRLYHNVHGRFVDVTTAMGLDRVTLPMGANFCDFDGDGYLDVYLATGEPGYEMLIPNLMFRNDGGRRFVDVTAATGLGHLQKGHGVAFADLDNDGDQDLWHQLGGFYPDDGYYNALFENTGGGRLLVLELVGTKSNRDAIGARVRVDLDTPGGPRSLHRAVGCVSSFGSSTLRQEIGLGDATAVKRVVVRWPAGGEQEFVGLPLGGHLRIVEGRGAAEPLARPAFVLGGRKGHR